MPVPSQDAPDPPLPQPQPSPPQHAAMSRSPNRLLYIAALGNPGAQYAKTRHNAGVLLLDALLPRLQERENIKPFLQTMRSTSYMNESGKSVVPGLTKFLAQADKSAAAVEIGLRGSEGTPATLVLLHDELESAPGKLKIRFGGPESLSLRGHRGLEDVFEKLNKKKMWNLGAKRDASSGAPDPREIKTAFIKPKDRLLDNAGPREFSVMRVGYGIGRPETRGRDDVADYVLSQMDARELKGVDAAAETVIMALEKEIYRARVSSP